MTMIACPHCQTQYTPERCGLPAADVQATVQCVVCRQAFDVRLTTVVRPLTTLIGRVLKRTETVVEAVSHAHVPEASE